LLPALFTMVRLSAVHSEFEVIAPWVPFLLVTWMASKFAWPKSASGRIEPLVLLGASAMTSALRLRQVEPLGQACAVAMLPPVVTSVSPSCQRFVAELK
jgi:hypothetical protein